MKKRLLSLLLALTMALSLATTGAWAADQDSIQVTVTIANQGAIAVGKNDTLMAQVLTDVIIANTQGDGESDHFWDNGEANLLKSLILYVDMDSTRKPEEKNLPAVYQMITQNTEKELTMIFDRLPLDHLWRAVFFPLPVGTGCSRSTYPWELRH